MQITNSVVCGASKDCIYNIIKPPLVGEHAFPLTGFVCKSAHGTIPNFVEISEGFLPYMGVAAIILINVHFLEPKCLIAYTI